ncbi:sulfur carrier protein ThiS [Alkalimonas sp. MEB108]|uniref:Sulfur carrier protein ThiS n=1 Tax=Alkalimonas cellulosilytica TaxID=3058395 RepID=A0ABU7J4E5_9GAMM|nr:sulfur carrier protein ThiS [Alkalimonas sp. MEB108]MEE2001381.1 sulfur carrier protein ThiS [Alkalimonas sp. MEB108]
MHITVNQQPKQVAEPCSLLQLVEQLALNPNGLALAVNHTVIAKGAWASTFLAPEDQVAAFQIVTGG